MVWTASSTVTRREERGSGRCFEAERMGEELESLKAVQAESKAGIMADFIETSHASVRTGSFPGS